MHRHELSVLHGPMRVRAFTQDDAHLFMLPEQIIDEIKGIIDLIDRLQPVRLPIMWNCPPDPKINGFR